MALIGGLKMNVFEDMILSELISRLDDEDNPKVYHREIYGQRYAMSIPLKQAVMKLGAFPDFSLLRIATALRVAAYAG